MPMLFWQLRLSDLQRIRSLFLCSPLKTPFLKMFKFSVLSTEKAAGENVLPLRELPCLCLMICVNIIKKAAKVLAAIFMIFYLTERKFVVLFLDRVTGYEPVGRGFESLLAHQRIYALCEFAGCVFCCQALLSTLQCRGSPRAKHVLLSVRRVFLFLSLQKPCRYGII